MIWSRERWWGRLAAGLAAAAVLGLGSAGCGDEAGCTKDYDCRSTQVCNTSTGECEAFVCAVDDDCKNPNESCQYNQCVSQ